MLQQACSLVIHLLPLQVVALASLYDFFSLNKFLD